MGFKPDALTGNQNEARSEIAQDNVIEHLEADVLATNQSL